jgi:hypothetical protein
MSRDVQNIEAKSQVWKLAPVPVADGLYVPGNPGVGRPDHPDGARGQEICDAADMIGMMVGE